MTVYISINGCHDSTLFKIDVDEKEYQLLSKLDRLSHTKSEYGCMPTISVYINEDSLKRNYLKEEDFD